MQNINMQNMYVLISKYLDEAKNFETLHTMKPSQKTNKTHNDSKICHVKGIWHGNVDKFFGDLVIKALQVKRSIISACMLRERSSH